MTYAQEQKSYVTFQNRYKENNVVYKFWNLPLLDHSGSVGVRKLQIREDTRYAF
jgi:hypothetical protein